MALARFTIFVVPARGRPGRPLRADDVIAGDVKLSWRLLAANNRDVARAALRFTDLDGCLGGVRALQQHIGSAAAVASRTGRADWSWRLRIDGFDVAVASRTYQRRLQCEAACALFVTLVPDAVVDVWPMAPHPSLAALAPTALRPVTVGPVTVGSLTVGPVTVGPVEIGRHDVLHGAVTTAIGGTADKSELFRP